MNYLKIIRYISLRYVVVPIVTLLIGAGLVLSYGPLKDSFTQSDRIKWEEEIRGNLSEDITIENIGFFNSGRIQAEKNLRVELIKLVRDGKEIRLEDDNGDFIILVIKPSE